MFGLYRLRKMDEDTCRSRVKLARGIVAGMSFIHSHGYVHCDLKPGNVLVSFDGIELSSKVSDLGLALPVPLLPPMESSHGAVFVRNNVRIVCFYECFLSLSAWFPVPAHLPVCLLWFAGLTKS